MTTRRSFFARVGALVGAIKAGPAAIEAFTPAQTTMSAWRGTFLLAPDVLARMAEGQAAINASACGRGLVLLDFPQRAYSVLRDGRVVEHQRAFNRIVSQQAEWFAEASPMPKQWPPKRWPRIATRFDPARLPL